MAYETLAHASDLLLLVAIILSSVFTLLLVTLPSQYDPLAKPSGQRSNASVTDEDKISENAQNAQDHASASEQANAQSVQIVVLGDIGRSPRMQYHAISFAKHGGAVQLIGYLDSELHPDVQHNANIKVVALVPTPAEFQTSNKALFLLLGPLKVLWQIWTLYHTLGYRTKPSKFILVQNPPSIPTLAVCAWMAFCRNAKLVIDWHNFGYSILALKLGSSHPLVRISRSYEKFFARQAGAHFAVTNAMVRVLKDDFGVHAVSLHDRPAAQFKPLSKDSKEQWLMSCTETSAFARDFSTGRWRLIVSSTSWTPDEDFSILLEALQNYSAQVDAPNRQLPKLLAIITGKGPQRQHYLDKIKELNQKKKLQHVIVATCWLSTEDYAALLGAADLGVSLHTSSSGVDLPMKVVDMFGTGLPVAAASFKALPELVKDNVNGESFTNSTQLTDLLVELLGGDGAHLERLRAGAMSESKRRWDDEWDPLAGQLFQLVDKI